MTSGSLRPQRCVTASPRGPNPSVLSYEVGLGGDECPSCVKFVCFLCVCEAFPQTDPPSGADVSLYSQSVKPQMEGFYMKDISRNQQFKLDTAV